MPLKAFNAMQSLVEEVKALEVERDELEEVLYKFKDKIEKDGA